MEEHDLFILFVWYKNYTREEREAETAPDRQHSRYILMEVAAWKFTFNMWKLSLKYSTRNGLSTGDLFHSLKWVFSIYQFSFA